MCYSGGMNQEKTCTTCGQSKPVTEYSGRHDRPDGRRDICKKCCAVSYREYMSRMGNERRKAKRKYYANNRGACIKSAVRRNRDRRQSDIQYRIGHNLRRRIRRALAGQTKGGSFGLLCGCTIDHLRQHLESQFAEGMSWDNYGKGGWEIDHIRPCCEFDMTNPSQQLECFNYRNLQPLWANDNRSKGRRKP